MQSLRPHAKAWLAVWMAWAAGFVDTVASLVLLHVYTSHMTGNTASFAYNLAEAEWQQAFHHGWPLVPFLAGLLFSATTSNLARRRGIHSSFSIALATEMVLLSVFIVLGLALGFDNDPKRTGPILFYCMLSLPAAAMGMQTVTVTRVAGLRVYTTYVTGSLSKFAEAVTHYAFWFYDRTHGRFAKRIRKVLAVSPRLKYVQHAAVTGGLWAGFFLGAFCGAVAHQRFGLGVLICPLAVLALAAAVDIARPVAAADEPVELDSAH